MLRHVTHAHTTRSQRESQDPPRTTLLFSVPPFVRHRHTGPGTTGLPGQGRTSPRYTRLRSHVVHLLPVQRDTPPGPRPADVERGVGREVLGPRLGRTREGSRDEVWV